MLFSIAETAQWKRERQEAYQQQPGDAWNSCDKRVAAIDALWMNQKRERMMLHLDKVLRNVVILVGEKATNHIAFKELWEESDALSERYQKVNTAETRWVAKTLLESLLKIPRSWGRTAAKRFFRGQGKQKDCTYPGAGVLSIERGWTESQVDAILRMFYTGDMAPLFMEDDSIDPDSKEGREISELGGNRFGTALKIRNDQVIQRLISMLDEAGVAEPVILAKDPPKPHKVKVFKPGDTVTRQNIRDLPDGAHLRLETVYLIASTSNPVKEGQVVNARKLICEMVLVNRTHEGLVLRPIVENTAFAPQTYPSAHLYKADAFRHIVSTVYIGQWEGLTKNITAKWNIQETIVQYRCEGMYPNYKYTLI